MRVASPAHHRTMSQQPTRVHKTRTHNGEPTHGIRTPKGTPTRHSPRNADTAPMPASQSDLSKHPPWRSRLPHPIQPPANNRAVTTNTTAVLRSHLHSHKTFLLPPLRINNSNHPLCRQHPNLQRILTVTKPHSPVHDVTHDHPRYPDIGMPVHRPHKRNRTLNNTRIATGSRFHHRRSTSPVSPHHPTDNNNHPHPTPPNQPSHNKPDDLHQTKGIISLG